MLESIRVTEKLHWPELELSKKAVLDPSDKPISPSQGDFQQLSSGILKDIFNTGTSNYNVLLRTKEEKKHYDQKPPLTTRHKRHRRLVKSSTTSRKKDPRKPSPPLPLLSGRWYCASEQSVIFLDSPVSSSSRFTRSISVAGSTIGLSPRPKSRARKLFLSDLQKPKLPPLVKDQGKEGDNLSRKFCILTAIKPSNVEEEKIKFFKSNFTCNPWFEYAHPALPNVLAKHSHASDRFLTQAVRIMELALQKYGSYEKFEAATGGCLLTKSRIWSHVRKYMERESCLGEIVVHLTDDLLSRASMTVVNGRPTLTINVSTAREHWLEGMLRHEIGTHYFRGMNNNQQPWCNWNGRKKHGLKPLNPTEEGLASIHSVLFRRDPFLWRAALLYYTVYQASRMSFNELFQSVGKFVQDPNTRWDYCVRAKRGQIDTSQPGCFSKDQVYLDGILKILRHRNEIDFQMLTALGKVSYEDVDRLKELALTENIRIPHFLQDRARYMEQLEKIMEVNELTDTELQVLI
ncbi:putative tyrosine carboxypeptidase MATCAP2 [Latimeria chalumnae]|uniref:putative tyrosine carboxypeptidase MATCAP2 n=1 Tax=Latimeria chalumnae TaxID=7897 RepID=UPI00313DF1F0